MNFENKMRELLNETMTERGFKLWNGINNMLPDIWNKSVSSTMKYHKRKDNTIPSVGEHTYEMLYSANKIMIMFNTKPKTLDADIILMSIALHDGLKYGEKGNRKHTLKDHDRLIANVVKANRSSFSKLYSDEQINDLIDGLRFHSGRWSADANKDFSFKDRTPLAMFTHMLDMLSTNDCLKF